MPWFVTPVRGRFPRAPVAGILALLCLLLPAAASRSEPDVQQARADDAADPVSAPMLRGSVAYLSGGDLWLLTGTGAATRLTNAGDAAAVRWSPGGRWLLLKGRDGQSALRVDGSRRVAASGAWSPDDSVRAVAAADGGIDLVSPDTGTVQKLVTGGANLLYEPVAWSPDGTTLALQRRTLGAKNPPTADSVWLVGRDGSGLRELVPAATTWPLALDWSPDGRWLAVAQGPAEPCVACRTDGVELSVVATDTKHTLDVGPVLRPSWLSWAPDSSVLVAAIGPGRESYRDKRLELLDLASGSLRGLASPSKSVEIDPAIDPASRTLAFTRGAAIDGPPFSNLDAAHGYPGVIADRHIWLLNIADGSESELPAAAGWADEAPRWAGPGALLFVRWRPAGPDKPPQAQLWLADTVTGALSKLVNDLGIAASDVGYYGELGWSAFFAWHP